MGGEGVGDEEVEVSVAVGVEEGGGDGDGVAGDPSLAGGVIEGGGAGFCQEVAEGAAGAVADGEEEILVAIVVPVGEYGTGGEAVGFGIGGEVVEGGERDPGESEIAEIAVEGAAVLGAFGGIGEEEVGEAIVVEIGGGGGVADGDEPFGDVLEPGVDFC